MDFFESLAFHFLVLGIVIFVDFGSLLYKIKALIMMFIPERTSGKKSLQSSYNKISALAYNQNKDRDFNSDKKLTICLKTIKQSLSGYIDSERLTIEKDQSKYVVMLDKNIKLYEIRITTLISTVELETGEGKKTIKFNNPSYLLGQTNILKDALKIKEKKRA
tara:strand:- start:10493 stop:10981 length:489 start_codon:yes stop_codon:yes gene_type:complete